MTQGHGIGRCSLERPESRLVASRHADSVQRDGRPALQLSRQVFRSQEQGLDRKMREGRTRCGSFLGVFELVAISADDGRRILTTKRGASSGGYSKATTVDVGGR